MCQDRVVKGGVQASENFEIGQNVLRESKTIIQSPLGTPHTPHSPYRVRTGTPSGGPEGRTSRGQVKAISGGLVVPMTTIDCIGG